MLKITNMEVIVLDCAIVNYTIGVPGPRTYYLHLLGPHLQEKIASRFQNATQLPQSSRAEPSRPQRRVESNVALQNAAQRGLIYFTRNAYIALSHCFSTV
jgi:hypothetical protein